MPGDGALTRQSACDGYCAEGFAFDSPLSVAVFEIVEDYGFRGLFGFSALYDVHADTCPGCLGTDNVSMLCRPGLGLGEHDGVLQPAADGDLAGLVGGVFDRVAKDCGRGTGVACVERDEWRKDLGLDRYGWLGVFGRLVVTDLCDRVFTNEVDVTEALLVQLPDLAIDL